MDTHPGPPPLLKVGGPTGFEKTIAVFSLFAHVAIAGASIGIVVLLAMILQQMQKWSGNDFYWNVQSNDGGLSLALSSSGLGGSVPFLMEVENNSF